MPRVGQARKRDWNERGVIQALQDIGVTVVSLSGVGLPDLLAWSPHDGFRLIEVKQPRGHLTPRQKEMREKVPFVIVRSAEQALALYGVRA